MSRKASEAFAPQRACGVSSAQHPVKISSFAASAFARCSREANAWLEGGLPSRESRQWSERFVAERFHPGTQKREDGSKFARVVLPLLSATVIEAAADLGGADRADVPVLREASEITDVLRPFDADERAQSSRLAFEIPHQILEALDVERE